MCSAGSFNPNKDLCRGDVNFCKQYALYQIRHSKTIQFSEQTLTVPIRYIAGSHLCPVSACRIAFYNAPCLANRPAFQYAKSGTLKSMLYPQFSRTIKKNVLAVVELNPSGYGSHSFRCGGVTLALACNIPSELIKFHGDWRVKRICCT